MFVKPQFCGTTSFDNSAIQIGPKVLHPVDFLVLIMEVDMNTLLIRLLLFVTTNVHIDVRVGENLLNINDKKEKFAFILRVK